jgi:hypothetical protein
MPERDLLDDLLLPDDGDTDDGDFKFDPEDIREMKEQIANISKEKQGLLKATQSERQKRQELQGRLDQITTTLNSMLAQREQLKAQTQSQKDEATLRRGIPIEYDDDGDGYIPEEGVKKMISPYEEKIAALEEELAATKQGVSQRDEYNETVAHLVSQKPEYDDAHRVYKNARKWISDRVADWSAQNGWRGPMNSAQALTHVIDDDFDVEFKEQFPGLDAFTITVAEDSPKHFLRMLESTSSALNATAPAPRDGRFQRVMNKPSSLGRSANAKGDVSSLAEKVGNLSATDILGFGDAEIDALSNYLRDDEEKDGIKWN